MKIVLLFLIINFSIYLCNVFYIQYNEGYLFYFN